jgi:hypothetical protein
MGKNNCKHSCGYCGSETTDDQENEPVDEKDDDEEEEDGETDCTTPKRGKIGASV